MSATSPSIDYDFDVHKENSYMYWWTRNYMDATQHALLLSKQNLKGKSVLDIGVGRGRTLTLYKRFGIKKVVGIDVDRKELSYAKAQAHRVDISFIPVVDNLHNTYLKSVNTDSYDVVALMNVLFCVKNERVRRTIVREAIRIVKPQGIIIVMDMKKPSIMHVISKITRKKWVFRNEKEIETLFRPLSLVATRASNFFYGINKPLDAVIKIAGPKFISKIDKLFATIGVPASTETFIFKKSHG